MKKINVRTVILVCICVVLGIVFINNGIQSKNKQTNISVETAKKPVVTVIINDGIQITTDSSIVAETPFAALTLLSQKKKLALTTKQYDFGIFVSAIGAVTSTKEKGWIYYVNGVSGSVAADKYQLKNGDVVEWKFETSIF